MMIYVLDISLGNYKLNLKWIENTSQKYVEIGKVSIISLKN